MKIKECKPESVSESIEFSRVTKSILGEIKDGNAPFFGDIMENGNSAWVVRDDSLEIIEIRNGNRLAFWKFGDSESTHQVSCVKECVVGGARKLLVGVQAPHSHGLLCVFDVGLSRVTTAIRFPVKITAVAPISTILSEDESNELLSPVLNQFRGVVAVGSLGGHVYLVDLNLDDPILTNERNSSQPVLIPHRPADLAKIRPLAISRGEHLAMELNPKSLSFSKFIYTMDNGAALTKFSASSVSVTSLLWVPQNGSLAVGFSFGGVQLWRLSGPVLEVSTPYEDHLLPVSHLAYQEPENDPQPFCYLWSAHGCVPTEPATAEVASLALHQLVYKRKETQSDGSHLYSGIHRYGSRFEMDLNTEILSSYEESSSGSRVVNLYTLPRRYLYTEDGGSVPDLGLLSVVWESLDRHGVSQCFVGLFDLDRWYHAQMPADVRVLPTRDQCAYLAFYDLNSVLESAAPDDLLGCRIDVSTLNRYVSRIEPPPDLHFFPSGHGFQVSCVLESCCIVASYRGVQESLINEISRVLHDYLVEPSNIMKRLAKEELLRVCPDSGTHDQLDSDRNSLLNFCLSHSVYLLPSLLRCVDIFTHPDFLLTSSGCTLRFLGQWLWNTSHSFKDQLDSLCAPLFDESRVQVDGNFTRKLGNFSRQLEDLKRLQKDITNQSGLPVTQEGRVEMETRLGAITLLLEHTEMISWAIKAGLLPECRPSLDDVIPNHFLFPGNKLKEFYANRRRVIDSGCDDNDGLIIDTIVSYIDGVAPQRYLLQRLAYPPTSVKSIIDYYLLPEVSIIDKHMVFSYLLRDISLFSGSQLDGGLVDSFGFLFTIPSGVRDVVEAVWLLDHGDADLSVPVLRNVFVKLELSGNPLLQTLIVQSLLSQTPPRAALGVAEYWNLGRSPNSSIVMLYFRCLLENGEVDTAISFVRSNKDSIDDSDSYLVYLFDVCYEIKKFETLLDIYLRPEEEVVLIDYLKNHKDDKMQELLVFYFLRRHRHIEAFRWNRKLADDIAVNISKCKSSVLDRKANREAVLNEYMNALPNYVRCLSEVSHSPVENNNTIPTLEAKLTPLSTKLLNRKSLTRGGLMQETYNDICEFSMILNESSRLNESDAPFIRPPCGTPISVTKATVTKVTPQLMDASNMSTSLLNNPKQLRESVLRRSLGKQLDESLNSSLLKSSLNKSINLSESGISSALQLLSVSPVVHKPRISTPLALRHDSTDGVDSPSSILKSKKPFVCPKLDSLKKVQPTKANPGKQLRFAPDVDMGEVEHVKLPSTPFAIRDRALDDSDLETHDPEDILTDGNVDGLPVAQPEETTTPLEPIYLDFSGEISANDVDIDVSFSNLKGTGRFQVAEGNNLSNDTDPYIPNTEASMKEDDADTQDEFPIALNGDGTNLQSSGFLDSPMGGGDVLNDSESIDDHNLCIDNGGVLYKESPGLTGIAVESWQGYSDLDNPLDSLAQSTNYQEHDDIEPDDMYDGISDNEIVLNVDRDFMSEPVYSPLVDTEEETAATTEGDLVDSELVEASESEPIEEHIPTKGHIGTDSTTSIVTSLTVRQSDSEPETSRINQETKGAELVLNVHSESLEQAKQLLMQEDEERKAARRRRQVQTRSNPDLNASDVGKQTQTPPFRRRSPRSPVAPAWLSDYHYKHRFSKPAEMSANRSGSHASPRDSPHTGFMFSPPLTRSRTKQDDTPKLRPRGSKK